MALILSMKNMLELVKLLSNAPGLFKASAQFGAGEGRRERVATDGHLLLRVIHLNLGGTKTKDR